MENGARKAVVERVPGIAPLIMDAHTFKKDDFNYCLAGWH